MHLQYSNLDFYCFVIVKESIYHNIRVCSRFEIVYFKITREDSKGNFTLKLSIAHFQLLLIKILSS